MNEAGGSITSGNTKDMLFTYSEEEKQDNEYNKINADRIFTPEFIPFYLHEKIKFKLTNLETLVYGFIRFFTSGISDKFYFDSEDLARILGSTKSTIDNSIKDLKDKGIIETTRRMKAGGGTMRYISLLNPKSPKKESRKSPTGEIRKSHPGEIHIKENNIKENKLILSKDNTETEVSFGNKEINDILLYLCKTIGIDEFKETKKLQRWYGKNFYNYINKIGKEDFIMRFKGILQDDFKSKNCNSIKYLYNEIKSFIHTPNIEPKKKAGAHFII